jgi:hypothetical protein
MFACSRAGTLLALVAGLVSVCPICAAIPVPASAFTAGEGRSPAAAVGVPPGPAGPSAPSVAVAAPPVSGASAGALAEAVALTPGGARPTWPALPAIPSAAPGSGLEGGGQGAASCRPGSYESGPGAGFPAASCSGGRSPLPSGTATLAWTPGENRRGQRGSGAGGSSGSAGSSLPRALASTPPAGASAPGGHAIGNAGSSHGTGPASGPASGSDSTTPPASPRPTLGTGSGPGARDPAVLSGSGRSGRGAAAGSSGRSGSEEIENHPASTPLRRSSAPNPTPAASAAAACSATGVSPAGGGEAAGTPGSWGREPPFAASWSPAWRGSSRPLAVPACQLTASGASPPQIGSGWLAAWSGPGAVSGDGPSRDRSTVDASASCADLDEAACPPLISPSGDARTTPSPPVAEAGGDRGSTRSLPCSRSPAAGSSALLRRSPSTARNLRNSPLVRVPGTCGSS